MNILSAERVGVVVVRAWLEHGKELRARIRHTRDIVNEPEVVTTVAGPDQVEATVRAWMESFLETETLGDTTSGDTTVTTQ